MDKPINICIVILTYNEEINIKHTLKSVYNWASTVCIVDSFSTDGTIGIVRQYTDRIFQNPFSSYASQRNWALENLPIQENWVLFLDADEQLTGELKEEIGEALIKHSENEDVGGFSIRHQFIFLNRPLDHAHMSIPHARIVRKGQALWQETQGAMEECCIDGRVLPLRAKLIHNDRKPLSNWIVKHDWYALEEAKDYLANYGSDTIPRSGTGHRSIRKFLETPLRRMVEEKIPLSLRPFLKFLYTYFLRRGFLDGMPGFAYCLLHDLWFPFLVYLKVRELLSDDNSLRTVRTSFRFPKTVQDESKGFQ